MHGTRAPIITEPKGSSNLDTGRDPACRRLPLYPRPLARDAANYHPHRQPNHHDLHVCECSPPYQSLMDFYADSPASLSSIQNTIQGPPRADGPATAPHTSLSTEASMVPDHLLSNSAFLDRLVGEVRRSCQADDADLRQLLSLPHSRSPSPCVEGVEVVVSNVEDHMPSSIGEASVSSSPNPKAPCLSPLGCATALGHSQRRGRAAGVSPQRSPSSSLKEGFATATTATATRRHPVVWAPKPVQEKRPAWNQRVLPPSTPRAFERQATTSRSLAGRRVSVDPAPSSPAVTRHSDKSCPSRESQGISPPSARALFTDPQPSAMPNPLLEQLAEAQAMAKGALEKATQAEACSARLEMQLRAARAEHEQQVEGLYTRIAQLTGQVSFTLRWIHGFDGTAVITTPPPEEPSSASSPVAKENPADLTLHGITPTSSRMMSSAGASAVRLPPSPPLVLQMHPS